VADEFVDAAYDAVLCLSVTKWVHFNWGDAGVKRLFRKAFASLQQGGVFILEPQDFKSYKKKKSLLPVCARAGGALTSGRSLKKMLTKWRCGRSSSASSS
jgi:hypothetical protein